jgi:anti-sigma regulatory factor (Ser/Thr protein kinase)
VTGGDSTQTNTEGRLTGPVLVFERSFQRDDLWELRAIIADRARDIGATAEQSEALMLVASELMANVMMHGGGEGRLRLWRSPAHMFCEVADPGPGMGDPLSAGSCLPRPEADGGRGLWLVRELSDDVQIHSDASGTTVAATMALRPRRACPAGGAHTSYG